ncbi:MAG: hypothetical protein AB1942_09705 [Pseudomonadota bacterium]
MKTILITIAALGWLLAVTSSASAQTAADVNRLNAAIQMCSSPAAAAIPECGQLRGKLGMGAPQGGYGGPSGGFGGGGKAQMAAGLLGSLMNASQARAAPQMSQAPVNAAAVQQNVAACVQRAAGDTAAIQACLSGAAAPSPVAMAAPTGGAIPMLGQYGGAPAGDPAVAIHQAGQSYQACAAANPTNWKSCLPLLNGGR